MNKSQWNDQYTLQWVYNQCLELQQEVKALKAEIETLKATKADRRGRKKAA